jgi:acetyl esterase
VIAKLGRAAVRASLLVSPWPAALLIRREFTASGRALDAALATRAPAAIVAAIDVAYDSHRDARLDAYWPASLEGTDRTLPTVVWIHGGGWLGGSKEEIGNYLRMIAARGFTAVGVRYSLAPGSRYPTPVRQAMAALRFLGTEGAPLHVDSTRVLLAGDSAGAHIGAQVAAIVTDDVYARSVGVAPTIAPGCLRGVGLCCGPYDLVATTDIEPMRTFFKTIVWSYSGTRRYRRSPFFATESVVHHVSGAFPPAFITVGNADPLREHSFALADALRAKGVLLETLFYPEDHEPALVHEYQFDLELDDARVALERLVSFFAACTAAG